MKIITDSRCVEYVKPGHPERPQRVILTEEKLRVQQELTLTWEKPATLEESQLLRAHSESHLVRLSEPVDLDADTPALPNILDHARRSVGGTLQALRIARQGEFSFSLMRPPGHHATRNRAMGFCYLSNMAIAVLEALASGVPKVAVLDFDVHHGNGTEAILLNQTGSAFFSIHQYPAYPGTGLRSMQNSYNYPVAPGTPRLEYRAVMATALEEIKRFQPNMLGVSAGFDAYRGDSIAQELLELEDYHWLGRSIRDLSVPTFSILEGGYSDDLPKLVMAYLLGLEGK